MTFSTTRPTNTAKSLLARVVSVEISILLTVVVIAGLLIGPGGTMI